MVEDQGVRGFHVPDALLLQVGSEIVDGAVQVDALGLLTDVALAVPGGAFRFVMRGSTVRLVKWSEQMRVPHDCLRR